MRSNLKICDPVDGHCRHSEAIRINDPGVCDRCRLIGGHPWAKSGPPRKIEDCIHRGDVVGLRACAACKSKTVKLKVFACAKRSDGAAVKDCRGCQQYDA